MRRVYDKKRVRDAVLSLSPGTVFTANDVMDMIGNKAPSRNKIGHYLRSMDDLVVKHLVEKFAEYVAKRNGWPVDPLLRLMCLNSAAILLKNPMHPAWKKWRYEN